MSNPSIDTDAPVARPGDTVEIIRRLRQKLEGDRRRRARQAGWIPRFIPTRLTALDTVLPHGGLPCGAVTEILSDDPGAGAMSLAVRIAAQSILGWPGQAYPPKVEELGRRIFGVECPIPSGGEGQIKPPGAMAKLAAGGRRHVGSSPRLTCRRPPDKSEGLGHAPQPPLIRRSLDPSIPLQGCPIPSGSGGRTFDDPRCLVLVDTTKDFYPPAAWQHGIAFDRLIVIRTNHWQEAFWAVDQSLRCRAVATVIATLPPLDERRSRRLQLAAKSSGCLGLILRPARGRTKSFAAVRILIESVPDDNRPLNEGNLAKQRRGMTKSATGGRRHVLAIDQCPSFSEPRAQASGSGRSVSSGWPTSSEVGNSNAPLY